jgi:hypothetical protein
VGHSRPQGMREASGREALLKPALDQSPEGLSVCRHRAFIWLGPYQAPLAPPPRPLSPIVDRPLLTGAVASGEDRPVDRAPLACSVPAGFMADRACSTACSKVDPASILTVTVASPLTSADPVNWTEVAPLSPLTPVP